MHRKEAIPFQATLRQLRFLAEVARQGSFTRAGEALYVSQPTVSAAIGELERQAGVPLVEVRRRRVCLTEAGRRLNEHGERILAELAAAERALRDMRRGATGRLLLGASSTPATYLLPPVLGRFRRAHPEVDLTLESGDTDGVLERVREGALDLGVVGEASFGPELRAERFRTETLVLIVAAGHPLARAPRVTARDLAGEPLLLREPGSSTRAAVERALAARGITPRATMSLGSTEAVKRAVAAGLGVALVSEHAVGLKERAGWIAVRRLPELALTRGFYVVWRATMPLAPVHERFLAALREPAQEPAPA